MQTTEKTFLVTDPGFTRRGHQPQSWGVPTYYFGFFFRKRHENDKNWTEREHASLVSVQL